MKRLFIILVFLLLLPSTALAQVDCSANCYIDVTLGDDTATVAQANSNSTPWQYPPGHQYATGNSAGYSPVANDTFIFKGGEIWRGTYTAPSSGSAGNRITYTHDVTWYTGGSFTNPKFSVAEPYPGTDQTWTSEGGNLYSSGNDYIRHDTTNLTTIDFITGAHTSSGRMNKYHEQDTGCTPYDQDHIEGNESSMEADFFYSRASEVKIWVMTSGGAPGTVYVGAYLNAFDVNGQDYITIDGIDFDGTVGATSEPSGSAALILTSGASFLEVKNGTLSQCTQAIRFSGNSDGNNLVDTVVVDDCKFGIGIFSTCTAGCTTAGDNIHITNSQFTNISERVADLGDNWAIGMITNYILIEQNYFSERGWEDMDTHCRIDTAAVQICCGADVVEFRYNYMYNMGHAPIIASTAGVGYGDIGNFYIHHNVIDGWNDRVSEIYSTGDASCTGDGVPHPCCDGVGVGDCTAGLDTYNQLKDYASDYDGIRCGSGLATSKNQDCYIVNNVVTGGIDRNTSTYRSTSAIRVKNDGNYDDVRLLNNITYGNSTDYELDFNVQNTYDLREIANNDFYNLAASPLYMFGTARDVPWLNAQAYATANEGDLSGDDPDLDSNHHVTDSSPAAVQDGGYDLAGDYQTGLDEDTTWSPLSVVTADWESYGGTHGMGAFVYGSEDSFRPTHSGVVLTGVDLQ